MRPIDYAKALGAAVVALALNLLVTTVVIVVWSAVVEPGHSQAYYNALAPKIGAWSGPPGGALLLFLAAYVLGRRRPERNAWKFAGFIWLFYALSDVAIALPIVPLAQLLTFQLTLSLLLALAGAALGGILAARRVGLSPSNH